MAYRLIESDRATMIAETGAPPLDGAPPPQRPDTHSERLCEHALAVVASTFQQHDLTLASVASCVGVSREHLCRTISAVTGRGLRAHVQAARVRAARDLLASTNVSVKETAFIVGYKSASVLIRHFAEQHGCTPRAYQIRARVGPEALPRWLAIGVSGDCANRGGEP